MKNYNNELLNDCVLFAEMHRGKNKQSGPYWSTIIRFPKLYDEAVRLKEYTEQLQAEIERLRSQVRTALKASQIDIDTNLLMNIEQLQAQLTHKVTIIAEQQSEIARLTAENAELCEANRWISVGERVPGEGEFVEVDYGNDEITVGSWFEEEIDHDEHEVFPPTYRQWQCWNFGDNKFVDTDAPLRWRNLPLPDVPQEEQ